MSVNHQECAIAGTLSPLDAFRVGKYGPTIDPTGAQVTYLGRLWDVSGSYRREYPVACAMLVLQSFDRTRTTDAPLSTVRVLIRR